MDRTGTHRIFTFTYHFVVILGVYDGIRSKLFFGGPFTYLKELSVLIILIGIVYLREKITFKELIFSNLFMILYLLSLGTVLIGLNDIPLTSLADIDRTSTPGGYALHFKTIEAFILIFIVFYYERLTHNKLDRLISFYIKSCFWYVIISLFLYFFVPESIILKPWWGRISVGYPTFDAQLLCFALFIILFRPTLIKNIAIYIIVLVIGIVINNTGSAYAMTAVVFCTYVFTSLSEKLISIKSLLIILISLFIIGAVLYLYNYSTGNFGVILKLKIDHILYKLTGLSYFEGEFVSEDLRDYQQVRAMSIKNSFLDIMLGGYITIAGVIENEYGFLFRAYGVVGVSLYYSWLLLISIFAIIKKNRLLLISILLYFIGTLAVPNTYSFGISLAFGLLLRFFSSKITISNPKQIVD